MMSQTLVITDDYRAPATQPCPSFFNQIYMDLTMKPNGAFLHQMEDRSHRKCHEYMMIELNASTQ